MKIKDIEDFDNVRYAEHIPAWFCNLEFVKGIAEYDYSGEVNLFGKDESNFYSLYYSYGSCPGCDTWEHLNLSGNEISKEISNLIIKYSPEEFRELEKRL